MDTIFALATGIGRSAVSVIRISGPDTGHVIAGIAGHLPAARRATLRALHTQDGGLLDQAIVLWMPGPGSFTGEDCAELHIHGGPAVRHAAFAALLQYGLRPAEPGEFSKRAFLNGKLDLLEAEGIADLVAAETDAQRRLALRQLTGAQSAALDAWKATLTRLLAWQEALIDFPDEDLPPDVEASLVAGILALHNDIAEAAEGAVRAARIRTGLTIAVIGPPNVGKSSLVNALIGRDVAIISPIAGTTRDALESWMDIAGIPVTLIDTAGLRETTNPVENEGVRRARMRAGSADIVLAVSAPGDDFHPPSSHGGGAIIAVHNKCDVAAAPEGWLGVSARTGERLVDLRASLENAVTSLTAGAGGNALSRERHLASLTAATTHLTAALQTTWPELRGEELRLAMQALGRITGAVGVEDILDVVFGAFCIGK